MQVGLVLRNELDINNEKVRTKISMAYNYYVSTRPDAETIASTFKKKNCCPVRIRFLGVW